MVLVFDATEHVYAAVPAGVPLYDGRRVDDLQFLLVGRHLDVVARNDRDDREQRAFRFPALRAAARVVVRDVALDRHLDRSRLAAATQRAARKVLSTLAQPLV